jgi:dehydrogenase/reductase SDR family protein 12
MVLFSYSKWGYQSQSRSWKTEDTEVDLSDRVCVVTGANSGIGFATAKELTRKGATVVLVCRDREKGERALAEILMVSRNKSVSLELTDLSSQKEIRELAERLARFEKIDVLIHNAGIMTDKRELSPDGIEKTFATNVLAGFLLTNLLLPQLKKAPQARVIQVSSGGMYTQKIVLQDLEYRRFYNGSIAYARSKRAQVILTELYAERLRKTSITFNSMHPGWVATPGVARSMPRFNRFFGPILRTPEQGADTVVWLAIAPKLAKASGKFWFDRKSRGTIFFQNTKNSLFERRGLWKKCAQMTGSDVT